MMKEKSLSACIIPVRNGKVAFLNYGNKGYGPIGGRVDDGEDLYTALRREICEELGVDAVMLANTVIEIAEPYSFKHTDESRAQQRGALSEEHHFFVARVPDNMELQFIEARLPNVEVIWLTPEELATKKFLYFNDLCEYYSKFIIPAIVGL